MNVKLFLLLLLSWYLTLLFHWSSLRLFYHGNDDNPALCSFGCRADSKVEFTWELSIRDWLSVGDLFSIV